MPASRADHAWPPEAVVYAVGVILFGSTFLCPPGSKRPPSRRLTETDEPALALAKDVSEAGGRALS